ncbi:MAG: hypothetical protein E4H47_00555 [Parcubacteria group bacterium]|nr:MAG: hypothetical protein E4H47_00555 [Parcubacteria group bacterium]
MKKIFLLIFIGFLFSSPFLVSAACNPDRPYLDQMNKENCESSGKTFCSDCSCMDTCAAGGGGDGGGGDGGGVTAEGTTIVNPLAYTDFQQIIEAVINFIFYVGIVLAPLMIIIAGFFILTARDDPKKVEQGRHTIIYTLVGLFVILFAKGIISILNYVMGVKTGT